MTEVVAKYISQSSDNQHAIKSKAIYTLREWDKEFVQFNSR